MCSWIPFAITILSTFCISVHEWNRSVNLCWILMLFKNQGEWGFDEFCNVPSVPILWNNLKGIVISSLLKSGRNLPCFYFVLFCFCFFVFFSWLGDFWWWLPFSYGFLFVWSWLNFGKWYLSRNLSILSTSWACHISNVLPFYVW